MARTKPYRAVQIDKGICDKLEQMMAQARYRGSFASFVESLLERIADGLLVERKDVESEIREQIFAELAADGIIIPPRHEKHAHERHRKAG
jgi:hypothetical protein